MSKKWSFRVFQQPVRLSETQKGSSQVMSAEMFAEEIVGRCPEIASNYSWDDQKLSTLSELRSGFTVRVIGDESDKKVIAKIDWMQTGERKYENVRKYIDTAVEKCCSRLKKGGWRISNRGIALGECHVHAEMNVSDLRKPKFLDVAATGLNESIPPLTG